jgi:hypothetical protein
MLLILRALVFSGVALAIGKVLPTRVPTWVLVVTAVVLAFVVWYFIGDLQTS